MKKRCRPLQKLFGDAPYHCKGKIKYAYLLSDFEERRLGLAVECEDDCTYVFLSDDYELTDGLVLHELCHAVLFQNGIYSRPHDNSEWFSMCDYFEGLGYDIYRNGYVHDAVLINK